MLGKCDALKNHRKGLLRALSSALKLVGLATARNSSWLWSLKFHHCTGLKLGRLLIASQASVAYAKRSLP